MVRIKRGVVKRRRRKKVLKQVKGFRGAKRVRFRVAKQFLTRALVYQYRDRKRKKREMRRKWQTLISAKVRELGLNYSKFMGLLKKKNVLLNRKILAQLVLEHPQIFEKIFEFVVK